MKDIKMNNQDFKKLRGLGVEKYQPPTLISRMAVAVGVVLLLLLIGSVDLMVGAGL